MPPLSLSCKSAISKMDVASPAPGLAPGGYTEACVEVEFITTEATPSAE